MARDNQDSIYWEEDNKEGLKELLKKYPQQSKNAFINAAMRFYLPYALRGVDGNLLPYTLENGPKLPPTGEDALKADIERIAEIVNHVLDVRERQQGRVRPRKAS